MITTTALAIIPAITNPLVGLAIGQHNHRMVSTMYCETNYKTKKQLKEAVASGMKIGIYAPGMGEPKTNGMEFLEGPWFPKPHTWYAQVEMKDGVIVKVK